MNLFDRRCVTPTDILPVHEIGYNLLNDVVNFEKHGSSYTQTAARWAGTKDKIRINNYYTYKIGDYNTRYYIWYFDKYKNFISEQTLTFRGGTLVIPAVARFVQVTWGLTDASIDDFRQNSSFRRIA